MLDYNFGILSGMWFLNVEQAGADADPLPSWLFFTTTFVGRLIAKYVSTTCEPRI